MLREAKIRAIQEGETLKDKMSELFALGLDMMDAAAPLQRLSNRPAIVAPLQMPQREAGAALALCIVVMVAEPVRATLAENTDVAGTDESSGRLQE